MTDTGPRLEAVAKAHRETELPVTLSWDQREARRFIAMYDALRAFDQAQESEVMPHSVETCDAGFPITDWACKKCPHCGATMDEACKGRTPAATAPVMGADPPWLDEAAKAALAGFFGKRPHSVFTQQSDGTQEIWRSCVRAVLAFANAQPPSEAEIDAGWAVLRHHSYSRDEVRTILIAADKARSGA